MDNIIYNTLETYFNILKYTGYRNYTDVYKIVVLLFIQELRDNELKYYITDNDKKAMQDLLYQLFGSTCEISFPLNNINCNHTKPSISSSTTTSTLPPQAITTTTSTPDPAIATTSSTPPPIDGSTTTSTKPPTLLIFMSDYTNSVIVDGITYPTNIPVYVSGSVQLEAYSPVGDYTFGYWLTEDGEILSYSSAFVYNPPSDKITTIYMVYIGDDSSSTTTPDPTITTTSTEYPTYEPSGPSDDETTTSTSTEYSSYTSTEYP